MTETSKVLATTDDELAWKADRYLNDRGEIAVVYSPGYGAGWTTWIDGLSPLDPVIAMLIDKGRKAEITQELLARRGFPSAYLGGLDDATIEWVRPGAVFRVDEYDGSESIVFIGDDAIFRA